MIDTVATVVIVVDVVQSGSGVNKHRYHGLGDQEQVCPRKQHDQGRQERQEGDLRGSPRGCELHHHPGGVNS